jgi:hypothetical protein
LLVNLSPPGIERRRACHSRSPIDKFFGRQGNQSFQVTQLDPPQRDARIRTIGDEM